MDAWDNSLKYLSFHALYDHKHTQFSNKYQGIFPFQFTFNYYVRDYHNMT